MRVPRFRRVLPAAFALWLAGSGSAWAELINLQFNGTITSLEGDEDPALRALFPLGGGASWLLTYESTTPESGSFPGALADPSFGVYDSTAIDWRGQVTGHEYTLPADASQRLFVRRDLPGLTFDNSIGATTRRGAIEGDLIHSGPDWFGQAFDFSVRWPGSSPFPSDALPTGLPSGSPDGTFTLYLHSVCPTIFGCTDRQLRVNGTISSVASVPEPATLAFVALGALGLAFRRGRRARAASDTPSAV